MLKKVCDVCGKDMSIDTLDENSFTVIINKSDATETSYSGDLCVECEEKIMAELTSLLKAHNLNLDRFKFLTK